MPGISESFSPSNDDDASVADRLIAGDFNVHELRRRWKPTKEGPAAATDHDAIRIRLHRAFSWMQRVEDIERADAQADDARLIYGWVALNALYGQWDAERREPMPDGPSLSNLLQKLFEHDQDCHMPLLLRAHKKLTESIVGDEYLNRYYWQDPGESSARRARNGIHKLRSMLVEGRHRAAVELTLERIYLARCQLVHGAATFGSKLNRDAIRRCGLFLELTLPVMAVIIIDHAWQDDWGELCYPPAE